MCAAAIVDPVRPENPAGVELSTLTALLGLPTPAAAVRVTGVTLRAQSVRPGDLFAALPGSTAIGADFAEQAVAAGAVAILTDPAGAARCTGLAVPVLAIERPRLVLGEVAATIYGRPSGRLAVIGITGTSGKTTTSYMIEAALRACGLRTGLIGTVATLVDGQVRPSSLTTPEAPDLQALLARMVEVGVQAVVMEVSSHSLWLGRVDGTQFAVGAFTNLSQDHLDFHHDMEAYFAAKEKLFDGRSAVEVTMVDDWHGRLLLKLHPSAITVSSTAEPADNRVTAVRLLPAGRQQFDLVRPDGEVDLEVGLPGPFNVANAALALTCARAAFPDLDPAQLAAGIAGAVVPGRMERVDAGQDFVVVVDYAHKPGALEAVLGAGADGLVGRLICVVGAGGDRDTGKRRQMGAIAASWADLVVVTDDNPRSEDPAAIRAELLAGARETVERHRAGVAEIRELGSRAEAIDAAIAAAGPGDLVIIAGKGHERGQEINGVVHPFADTEAAAAALARRGHQTGARS